ncbi:hypothetical protein GA0111570_103246 [Raineyella antarctica]|uniref:Uncharacterized protein n=1 Tax=Raineyella antarctica TaxID=1577474 RepID=A0A1G6GH40_9ACTN|nr:hypothetical protein [Raineyella antarctica]SDB81260.1 hypothetical protein GA0111570_103246 [Raineyella antarctica]
MRARPNVVLLVIAVLVAALATTAAVVAANRKPSPPDLATPEGVVEAYVVAVITADQATATSFLDPTLNCQSNLQYFSQQQGSFTVVSSRTSGSTAWVVAEISMGGGGPLPDTTNAQRFTFQLVSRDGHWLVTGDPWPGLGCKEN